MPKLCNRSGEQAAASMTVSEPRARLTFSRIALGKSPYMQPALLATEKTCLYAMHPGQLGDLNPWAIVSSLISPRAPKFSVFPFVPVHNPEPTQMPQDCRSAAAPSFLLRPGILSVRNETPQKIKIKSKCSQWRFSFFSFFRKASNPYVDIRGTPWSANDDEAHPQCPPRPSEAVGERVLGK